MSKIEQDKKLSNCLAQALNEYITNQHSEIKLNQELFPNENIIFIYKLTQDNEIQKYASVAILKSDDEIIVDRMFNKTSTYCMLLSKYNEDTNLWDPCIYTKTDRKLINLYYKSEIVRSNTLWLSHEDIDKVKSIFIENACKIMKRNEDAYSKSCEKYNQILKSLGN